MILLIDNYDSFAYNLYQMVGAVEPDITVVRNDAFTLDDVAGWRPSKIILSPGPGRPKDAGLCEDVIRRFAGVIPILGVCLGHQAICEAYGAVVSYAKEQLHGKPSQIEVTAGCALFEGMPNPFQGARYHSLAALPETMPDALTVTAKTADGEVMAVKHRDYDVFGVQFHPESVLTPHGHILLKNFINL